MDPLAAFSPATRAWFASAFEAPTDAQTGAWEAISDGNHALVVAPTGSGKTLAAFLSAIDTLTRTPPPEDPTLRCRVVYVSPLKALAVDVDHNLNAPLVGIRHAAARLGEPFHEVTVAVRTGDTPAADRRRFGVRPSDILITTPESLFLVLTSAARAGLGGVTTVIVDEIHALAGTKRGAHLAVSLERLDELLPAPAQRIGLSATVRPVGEVGRFLAGHRSTDDGGRPVRVVAPPADKQVDITIEVPVEDLRTPDATERHGTGAPGPALPADVDAGPGIPTRQPSIWPHVEDRLVDLVTAHRSTLVFTNSRRTAERLTSRLNENWAERTGIHLPTPGEVQPNQAPANSGAAVGAEPILARAHHGSMSRAERDVTESELKAGCLPAVVATSSLELGIDMGAVDLVVQVGSPPSVASALQRIGRAGHQVGAVSTGVVLPTHAADLLAATVVAARARDGAIEALHVPANPLDVLAQQIVAMTALDDWELADLAALIRRAAPFADLGDASLVAVLDMLAGQYPSEEFAELRPRIVWDRVTDTLHGRPGALRLAATSGGTIPDRGLFPVYLVGADRGGRRVGELDEEMVYESRVGDHITLGSTTWRIEEITAQQVLVSPAPGTPGRLPFWKGDSQGRPAELGRAVGETLRRLGDALRSADGSAGAERQLADVGLDDLARQNLAGYLREQTDAAGLPDDRTIVVERFRDEIGDWRIVIHSPWGARVNSPWALVLGARLRDRFGVDASVMAADDGIVTRLPDVGLDLDGPAWSEAGPHLGLDDLFIAPDAVASAVREQLAGSSLFAARFRESAARALLLPRRRPDRRQPLWQQRQRSAQLLSVAAQYAQFPIVAEAVREVLLDDFEVPALAELMAAVEQRRVRIVDVTTPMPSPFARSLLFGYTAQFLYEGDAPLAERRAAALTLDPGLLAELLGESGTADAADLLDPEAVERTHAELTGTAADRRARTLEQLADVVRRQGPLTLDDAVARAIPDAPVDQWLADLVAARRVLQVGRGWFAAVEDAGRLRDGLGVPLPVGVAEVFTQPVPDPVGDLVRRHLRTHAIATAEGIAARFGLGVAVVSDVLHRLERSGSVVGGRLAPASVADAWGLVGRQYADADVMRTLRRRSLAAARAEVEPVSGADLAVFLPQWQGYGALHGVDGLLRVVEQLTGAALPASAWEQLVFPARIADYAPAMLDELTASGQVLWCAHREPSADDPMISFHLADTAEFTLPAVEPPTPDPASLDARLADLLSGGGAFFTADAARRLGEAESDVLAALWRGVWAGRFTNDSFGPVRDRLGRGRTTHRPRRAPARPRPLLRTAPRVVVRDAGRWSALPSRSDDESTRATTLAGQLLDRHGVLTRAVAPSEGVGHRFGDVVRVLRGGEEAGLVRRGYFVERLGGTQFALPGAVDLLRSVAASRAARESGSGVGSARGTPPVALLAATDPANPFGAALAWPAPLGAANHRPGRKPGGVVVIVDGNLVLYLERGGRTLLSFTDEVTALDVASTTLAEAARAGRLGRFVVDKGDGQRIRSDASPLAAAMLRAGFVITPRGLRLRGMA